MILIKKAQITSLLLLLPLLLTSAFWMKQAAASSPDTARYQLKPVDADMSAYEYRCAYRDNQHRVRKFITHYSKSTLRSLGISKDTVGVVAALAGAAITQDATLYLNASKSLALDVRNAGRDDRAVFFALKHAW